MLYSTSCWAQNYSMNEDFAEWRSSEDFGALRVGKHNCESRHAHSSLATAVMSDEYVHLPNTLESVLDLASELVLFAWFWSKGLIC